ncbi:hypothetical protein QLQ12_39145 [Actinoplanes sp. NEAU-A12]|uniref:Uncharacterized protein n=1 Tax=Actinoplanes sandaracinus TaxID=3045177 RepID=A0ABT6WY01_9ACTN|nr:hypothetical protein [Actinoplanes sandaracinus]MDI6104625.1 hypothetical protein [Actinoplanes sandaracinus]
MTVTIGLTEPRWAGARRIAGYGAAVAMVPYLVVKIVWTIDGLRGGGLRDGAWSRLDWSLINGLTVGMAGAAILLGLALCQEWGMRIPGWALLGPAWIGAGFLVPMVPVLPALLAVTPAVEATPVTPVLPAWEPALLSLSFAGFGLGVAIAFPLYVRHRWPDAFTGLVPAAGATRAVQRTVATFAVTVTAGIGLPQVYWALGGTAGLNQATLGNRDGQWHLLTGNSGLWALIAAWGVWAVTHRSATAGQRIPLVLSWVASGFLFAWGTWKAIFAFAVVPEFPPPEPLWSLAAVNHFGALAGLAILLVVLTTTARASETAR